MTRFKNLEVLISKENICKPYYILKSFEYDQVLEKLLSSKHTPQERLFDKLIYIFE